MVQVTQGDKDRLLTEPTPDKGLRLASVSEEPAPRLAEVDIFDSPKLQLEQEAAKPTNRLEQFQTNYQNEVDAYKFTPPAGTPKTGFNPTDQDLGDLMRVSEQLIDGVSNILGGDRAAIQAYNRLPGDLQRETMSAIQYPHTLGEYQRDLRGTKYEEFLAPGERTSLLNAVAASSGEHLTFLNERQATVDAYVKEQQRRIERAKGISFGQALGETVGAISDVAFSEIVGFDTPFGRFSITPADVVFVVGTAGFGTGAAAALRLSGKPGARLLASVIQPVAGANLPTKLFFESLIDIAAQGGGMVGDDIARLAGLDETGQTIMGFVTMFTAAAISGTAIQRSVRSNSIVRSFATDHTPSTEFYYHGTSTAKIEGILESGLFPDSFLTTKPHTASMYASTQTAVDDLTTGAHEVVLRIRQADVPNVRSPDENFQQATGAWQAPDGVAPHLIEILTPRGTFVPANTKGLFTNLRRLALDQEGAIGRARDTDDALMGELYAMGRRPRSAEELARVEGQNSNYWKVFNATKETELRKGTPDTDASVEATTAAGKQTKGSVLGGDPRAIDTDRLAEVLNAAEKARVIRSSDNRDILAQAKLMVEGKRTALAKGLRNQARDVADFMHTQDVPSASRAAKPERGAIAGLTKSADETAAGARQAAEDVDQGVKGPGITDDNTPIAGLVDDLNARGVEPEDGPLFSKTIDDFNLDTSEVPGRVRRLFSDVLGLQNGPSIAAKKANNAVENAMKGRLPSLEDKIPTRVQNAATKELGGSKPGRDIILPNGREYRTLHSPKDAEGLTIEQMVQRDAFARGAVPLTGKNAGDKVDRFRMLAQLAAQRIDTHGIRGETQAEFKALMRSFDANLFDSKHRPRNPEGHNRSVNILMEAIGTPQTIWTSTDASALFRQMLVLGPDNPRSFLRASAEGMRAWADPKRARMLNAQEIARGHQNGFLASNGRLFDELATGDVKGVERALQFNNRWTDRAPFFGSVIKPRSEASFSLAINKFRNDVFERYVDDLVGLGLNPTPATRRGIAEFVTAATGTGNLGRFESDITQRSVFFSVAFQASRVQTITKGIFAEDLPTRKLAYRSLAKMLGLGVMTLALLDESGLAEVNADPWSTDFGQIKVGNTRIDIWGGFRPWAVFMARIAGTGLHGQRAILGTGEHVEASRFDLVKNFLFTKFGPVPSLGQSLERGHDIGGAPFGITEAFIDAITPLIVQGAFEAMEDEGLTGLWTVLPEFVGFGVNTFESTGSVKQATTERLFADGEVQNEHYRELGNLDRSKVDGQDEVRAAVEKFPQDEESIFQALTNGRAQGEAVVLKAITLEATPRKMGESVRRYKTITRLAGEFVFADADDPKLITNEDVYRDLYWGATADIDPDTLLPDFQKLQVERDRVLQLAEDAGIDPARVTERLADRFKDPQVQAVVENYEDTVVALRDIGFWNAEVAIWDHIATREGINAISYPAWVEQQVKALLDRDPFLGDEGARQQIARSTVAKSRAAMTAQARFNVIREAVFAGNATLIFEASSLGLLNIPADLEALVRAGVESEQAQ